MTFQGHLQQFIDLLWPSHGRFVTWCSSGGSEIKASACSAVDPGSEMATHCSTITWRIPWTEEPGGLQSTGLQGVDTTERLHFTSPYIFRGCQLALK